MPKPKRDKLINIRVTEAERAKLAQLAELNGETISDVLRRAMLGYVRRHEGRAGKL